MTYDVLTENARYRDFIQNVTSKDFLACDHLTQLIKDFIRTFPEHKQIAANLRNKLESEKFYTYRAISDKLKSDPFYKEGTSIERIRQRNASVIYTLNNYYNEMKKMEEMVYKEGCNKPQQKIIDRHNLRKKLISKIKKHERETND